jgi:hypothetical protein
VYTRGKAALISVRHADGREERIDGNSLPVELSALVFGRSGAVERIQVTVPA